MAFRLDKTAAFLSKEILKPFDCVDVIGRREERYSGNPRSLGYFVRLILPDVFYYSGLRYYLGWSLQQCDTGLEHYWP
jgi:hypothetical protein